MPRTCIYFDDISPKYEFQGEALAIKEFNKENEKFKISPDYCMERLKTLHCFKHKLYTCNIDEAPIDLPYLARSTVY